MDNHEKPNFNLIRPTNSLLYSIVLRDSSGVSNLYKAIHHNNSTIVQNICTKWFDKSGVILHPYEVKNSFNITNKQIDDTFLRHSQFRTLHYRYYTNNILLKCKIIDNDTCSLCQLSKDSNFHMLIDCVISQDVWSQVERWIRSLGMLDYILTDRRKILGDLENNPSINITI